MATPPLTSCGSWRWRVAPQSVGWFPPAAEGHTPRCRQCASWAGSWSEGRCCRSTNPHKQTGLVSWHWAESWRFELNSLAAVLPGPRQWEEFLCAQAVRVQPVEQVLQADQGLSVSQTPSDGGHLVAPHALQLQCKHIRELFQTHKWMISHRAKKKPAREERLTAPATRVSASSQVVGVSWPASSFTSGCVSLCLFSPS